MQKKLELFLLKAQSKAVYDFSDAGAETFAGTDLIEVIEGSTIDREQPVDPLIMVSGQFDQDAAVPGDEGSKGTLTFPMIPAIATGPGGTPNWGLAAKTIGAFAETYNATSGGSGGNYFKYLPVSEPTVAGIIKHFTGSTLSSAAIASIHYNLLADWKISIAANKAPTIVFTTEGAWCSQSNATQPSITKARVSPIAFKGATVQITGVSTYKILSAEISGNQPIVNLMDVTQANGRGGSKKTDSKIKFTAKVYCATTDVVDPVAALKASTEGAIQFKWGSTTKAINIQGTYAQITKAVRSDDNGITTFDLEGQFNRNDFKIEINPA